MNKSSVERNFTLSWATFSNISIVYFPLSPTKNFSKSKIFFPTPNGSGKIPNSPLVINVSSGALSLTSNIVGLCKSVTVTTTERFAIGNGNIGWIRLSNSPNISITPFTCGFICAL